MSQYRGFLINTELSKDASGFTPSFHDPRYHKNEGNCAVPSCARDTVERAEQAMQEYIDRQIAAEADEVIEKARRSTASKK
jgi:hypothetical protein